MAIGGHDLTGLVAPGPYVVYHKDSVFRAIFEGNGHTVANLFVRGDSRFVGLFGIVGSPGAIRHVGMIDVDVTGRAYVGGLTRVQQRGAVVRSYATGRVATTAVDPDPDESRANHVGGLVGRNRGAITRSHAHVRVAGDDWTGGLAGNNRGAVVASYVAGVVTGGVMVGGLVGENSGTVRRSYATGAVSGERFVGRVGRRGRTHKRSRQRGSQRELCHGRRDGDGRICRQAVGIAVGAGQCELRHGPPIAVALRPRAVRVSL